MAAVAAFILLVYAYADWNGRRAWRRYVAEATARGERLDPESIIPPEIPDEENFAAAPLFRPLFEYTLDPLSLPDWKDLPAKEALDQIKLNTTGPKPRANPFGGEQVDLVAWQKALQRSGDKTPLDPALAAADVRRALSAFDREWERLLAAVDRPHARFPIHYRELSRVYLPQSALLFHLGEIGLLREVVSLQQGKVDEAFRDELVLLRLADADELSPYFISFMMRHFTQSRALAGLREGLLRHAWSEQQLARFEARLAPVNLVAHYRATVEGERALFLLPSLLPTRSWSDFFPFDPAFT